MLISQYLMQKKASIVKEARSEELLHLLSKDPKFKDYIAQTAKTVKYVNKDNNTISYFKLHPEARTIHDQQHIKNSLGIFTVNANNDKYITKAVNQISNPVLNSIDNIITSNPILNTPIYSNLIRPLMPRQNVNKLIENPDRVAHTNLLSISPDLKKTKYKRLEGSGLYIPEHVSSGNQLFLEGATDLNKNHNVNKLTSDTHVSEPATYAWKKRDDMGLTVDFDPNLQQGDDYLAHINKLGLKLDKNINRNAFQQNIVEEFNNPRDLMKYMNSIPSSKGRVALQPWRQGFGGADYNRNFFPEVFKKN